VTVECQGAAAVVLVERMMMTGPCSDWVIFIANELREEIIVGCDCTMTDVRRHRHSAMFNTAPYIIQFHPARRHGTTHDTTNKITKTLPALIHITHTTAKHRLYVSK
jgi:hypothetical protein